MDPSRRVGILTASTVAVIVGIAVLALARSMTPSAGAAPLGGYLDFTGPGPGYMEVASDPPLSPSQGVTVEAWVSLRSYLGGYGTQSDCPVIAGKDWTEAYMLSLACGGDYVEAYVNGQQAFAEEERLPLNEWTHVAMSYNGSTVSTYVNGIISASAQVDGPLGQSDAPLRIGSDVSWDRTPNALIDDVRVWDLARSAAQIQAGMNNVASNTPGLVARWTFVNGSLEDVVAERTGVLVGDVIAVEDPSTPTPTPSPLPTPSPVPTGTPVPVGAKGDIDCDQRIDIRDVTALLRELAGTRDVPSECNQPVTPTPTPCPPVTPTNCDVVIPSPTPNPILPDRLNLNCDEVVDERDALSLLLHMAVIDDGLPEMCAPIGGVAPTPTPGPTGGTTPTPTPTTTPGVGTPTPTPTATATPGGTTPTPTPTATIGPSPPPSASPSPTPSPGASPSPTVSPAPSA
jgi:hypothetical protein